MTLTDTPASWAPPAPSRLQRFARGSESDPAWARPGLLALLGGTALLYLVNLSASGYGNDFYAAAVQAGTTSWKAFLFGSFDPSNFITVDKPPASLWVMELSGRIFGFNSWSMFAPQALEGVAAVALLYAAVRRWFGPAAGLIAGLCLAVTPVAVLMFRFNNPDALMTLLCVAACYYVVRALEHASTRWLLLAGTAMGFAFLTKSLQPLTILPALAMAYLVAAPASLGRRVGQLLLAGGAVVLAAGWWVLLVTVWPVGSRPYIGGSGDNTVLGLAFGYNGLSRITGSQGGGPGGGGPGGGSGFGGAAGLGRLFNSEWGTQIAWLIPSALLLMVACLALFRAAPRTDRLRAALIVWGGYLLVTGAVLSFAGGIVHPYYAIQLAPAIAALVAIGGRALWNARADINARIALAVAVGLAGGTSVVLLGRSSWHPELRVLVLVATAAAMAALLALVLPRRLVATVPAVALLAGGGASAAYAVQTASTAHSGSIVSAGPAATGGTGGFGAPGGGTRRRFGGFPGGQPPQFPGGVPGGQLPPFPQGGFPGAQQSGGGPGGGGTSTNSELVALLKATTTRWAAATIGSQSAAPLQLASGKAIMAIGGFSGSDAAPTLTQFQQWVREGKIGYFVAGGGGFGGRGGNSDITSWVESTFTPTTVGGTTAYDLRGATS